MREIVFDTETTGMDPSEGERLVEIGAFELINHVPTGRTYHQYINPECEVSPEAVAVHGLDNKRLENEPVFGEIIGDFIDFVGDDSKLVAHNAQFDMKFINFQIAEFGFPHYPQNRVIDTLAIARKKFPGSPASLDALCRRFAIDNSERVLHGALLDAELLAEVYLELLGGRQQGLDIEQKAETNPSKQINTDQKKQYREARTFKITEDELIAHQKMCAELGDKNLWK